MIEQPKSLILESFFENVDRFSAWKDSRLFLWLIPREYKYYRKFSLNYNHFILMCAIIIFFIFSEDLLSFVEFQRSNQESLFVENHIDNQNLDHIFRR
ncbi:hypothetical protein HE1_00490 [Holospora elegans E1]|uniref:Uncharacterized protein n=1 Tax=Holospora elegans E1 TaxID=1427503 RepID=A0A023DYT2_9PROT|nr:hypothetical protein HE1_00490 [Holospora elegans E1]